MGNNTIVFTSYSFYHSLYIYNINKYFIVYRKWQHIIIIIIIITTYFNNYMYIYNRYP